MSERVTLRMYEPMDDKELWLDNITSNEAEEKQKSCRERGVQTRIYTATEMSEIFINVSVHTCRLCSTKWSWPNGSVSICPECREWCA